MLQAVDQSQHTWPADQSEQNRSLDQTRSLIKPYYIVRTMRFLTLDACKLIIRDFQNKIRNL